MIKISNDNLCNLIFTFIINKITNVCPMVSAYIVIPTAYCQEYCLIIKFPRFANEMDQQRAPSHIQSPLEVVVSWRAV